MRARVRHEWLQKHATPSSAGGDFHWHPARVDAALRLEVAERARGCAAWALLAPGRVVWAEGFAATAPADGRRYGGVVATIVEALEGAAVPSAAALLAAVPAPPARPWQPGDGDGERVVDVREPDELAAADGDALAGWSPDEAGAAAAALRTGAAMACAAIGAWTPRALATLDAWIDPAVRARPREVAVRAGAAAAVPALDHYAGQAWRAAAGDAAAARRVWRAALALAARDGRTAEAFFDELAALAAAWDRADELDAWLGRAGVLDARARAAAAARGLALTGDDAGWLWSRVVHAWGRGALDAGAGGADAAADPIADRLAATLAGRIVADHLIALERAASPLRYWRRLRWEALLPRARRERLEAGVRARIPTLVGAREAGASASARVGARGAEVGRG